MTGTDGRLHYPVYEGRGNHDGGNSSGDVQPHFVASEIIARNQLRKNAGWFNITAISESGLHYAWTWSVGDACTVHFVMLNEYAGHICEGCNPVSCFYGPACYAGWNYPEDSLGFLESYLSANVNTSGAPVFAIQHYGFDGYSNSWYSDGQRLEFFNTLNRYNTLGVIVGHTHAAAIYGWNGTATFDTGTQPGIDVYNVPATQKGGTAGAEPSEYMLAEISILDAASKLAHFRLAHRQVPQWGPYMATKNFTCAA
jgi:hypothetical protein